MTAIFHILVQGCLGFLEKAIFGNYLHSFRYHDYCSHTCSFLSARLHCDPGFPDKRFLDAPHSCDRYTLT